MTNLRSVCQNWRDIIDSDYMQEPINKQRFLKGVLIYRPNGKSDEGMVTLKISDLENPFEGTFDLSGCGDAGLYLNISTGHRKEKNLQKVNKIEMLVVLRHLVVKELQGSASHLNDMLLENDKWFRDRWTKKRASVGIFWTWGGWDNMEWYDYLTHQSREELSNKNLYKKWSAISRFAPGSVNMTDEHFPIQLPAPLPMEALTLHSRAKSPLYQTYMERFTFNFELK